MCGVCSVCMRCVCVTESPTSREKGPEISSALHWRMKYWETFLFQPGIHIKNAKLTEKQSPRSQPFPDDRRRCTHL